MIQPDRNQSNKEQKGMNKFINNTLSQTKVPTSNSITFIYKFYWSFKLQNSKPKFDSRPNSPHNAEQVKTKRMNSLKIEYVAAGDVGPKRRESTEWNGCREEEPKKNEAMRKREKWSVGPSVLFMKFKNKARQNEKETLYLFVSSLSPPLNEVQAAAHRSPENKAGRV